MDVKCMFHVYEQWSLVHGRYGIALSKSKVVVVVAIPLSLFGFFGVFFFGQFPTPNWCRFFYKLCLCASQNLPSLI